MQVSEVALSCTKSRMELKVGRSREWQLEAQPLAEVDHLSACAIHAPSKRGHPKGLFTSGKLRFDPLAESS